eukprot:gene5274-6567_t
MKSPNNNYNSAWLFIITIFIIILINGVNGSSNLNVTYDHRSLLINGERKILISGSVHYPRSTPGSWPSILKLSKKAGIDVIDTYVFWNLHQPNPNNDYNFNGNANITHFLDLCKKYDLYVILRLGPYVCAEWSYGGFPEWLREIPGIVFRDYNQPFMNEMSKWISFIVDYLRPYFASNGGPIILAQIENEYGWLEKEYGQSGKQYAQWSINFAQSLNIGIPWIMCAQDDIESAINTCNGFYCHDWIKQHWDTFPNQPAFWTENWPGWFQEYGQPVPHRPVQDVLFSVARWIAYGGSLINYYMWYGGSNFDWYPGGPFIIQSYDYDVAINEYGFPHEPKFSKSLEFHSVIHQFQELLLSVYNPPQPVSLSTNVELHLYSSIIDTSNSSLAFITNFDNSNFSTIVTWNDTIFFLQPWSVIIVQDNNVIFDTSNTQFNNNNNREITYNQFIAFNNIDNNNNNNSQQVKENVEIEWWSEPFIQDSEYPIKNITPMELLSITHDKTDYLWYETTLNSSLLLIESSATNGTISINFTNTNDLVIVFINQQFIGNGIGPKNITIDFNISNIDISNQNNNSEIKFTVICKTMGLVNYAPHMEQYSRGILGTVKIGSLDITQNGWRMSPGLMGESLALYNQSNFDKVNWTLLSTSSPPPSLGWYKIKVPAIEVPYSSKYSFALNMTGMTRGFIWVNGYPVGRYFMINATGDGDVCDPSLCSYIGYYNADKCRSGCGEPSQSLYHVPNDCTNINNSNDSNPNINSPRFNGSHYSKMGSNLNNSNICFSEDISSDNDEVQSDIDSEDGCNNKRRSGNSTEDLEDYYTILKLFGKNAIPMKTFSINSDEDSDFSNFKNLTELPSEVVISIFENLTVLDLKKVKLVCKLFYNLTGVDSLWKGKCYKIQYRPSIPNQKIPSIRLCPSSVIHNDNLFIFGGDNGFKNEMINLIGDVKNDLWCYNFKRNEWYEVMLLDDSPNLTEHSSIIYDGKMIIFGGSTGVPPSYSKETYIVDLEKKRINLFQTMGDKPSPRSAHVAVLFKDSMYIFGGWNSTETYGDFYKLNLLTGNWSTVEQHGDIPFPRRAHCGVLFNEELYIFGGYDNRKDPNSFNILYKFSFKTNHWKIIECNGDIPSGRSRASMIEYNSKIYLIGGWNRHDYFADIYKFDIENSTWKKIDSNLDKIVVSLGQNSVFVHNSRIGIFGGYIPKLQSSSNDLFVIRI